MIIGLCASLLFFKEVLDCGAEFPLEFVLHPLLPYELYELARLSGVLAGHNVTLGQRLILTQREVSQISDGRRHNNEGAPKWKMVKPAVLTCRSAALGSG